MVCKCYFPITNIERIRRYLTPGAIPIIVHAFISTKRDYGDALLIGLSKKLINKLQCVQNSLARLVCYKCK